MTIRSLQWTCLALSLSVHAVVLYGLGRSQWLAAPALVPILSVNLVAPPVDAPKTTATPRVAAPRPAQPVIKQHATPAVPTRSTPRTRTHKNNPPDAGVQPPTQTTDALVQAGVPSPPQPIVAANAYTPPAEAVALAKTESKPHGARDPALPGAYQAAQAVTTDTAADNAPVGAAGQSAGPVALSTDLALACPDKSPARYPLLSRRLNESGTVLLRVEVDERGTVAAAGIARSSGFARLDAAALAAVRTWRCRAPTHNGQPVRATALQPFHFKLED